LKDIVNEIDKMKASTEAKEKTIEQSKVQPQVQTNVEVSQNQKVMRKTISVTRKENSFFNPKEAPQNRPKNEEQPKKDLKNKNSEPPKDTTNENNKEKRNSNSKPTTEKCFQCGDDIGSIHYLKALDQQFHVNCFYCDICKKSLVDQTFVPSDDKKPICTDCYKTCLLCGKLIKESYIEFGDGALYHTNCFQSLKKCDQCGQEITSDCYDLGGKLYHKNCFTCQNCGAEFDGNYFVSKQKNLCKKCSDIHSDED